MNSALDSKPVRIDLNIGDQLTSISCGHIVVELIKFIAYQRQQIPYAYPWLKQVVNNKKLSEETDEEVKQSLQSERHFRIASTALENLDFILKSLLQEINGSSIPDEVCIAFGTTPVTCKEVYRLLLPTACHKQQCHSTLIATDQKIQRNVFRSLVTAEKLSQVFFKRLGPTNMYVFLKKKTINNHDNITSCENFQQTSGCRIPRSSKIIVIDFRTHNRDDVACCNNIQIFGDVTKVPIETTESHETHDPHNPHDYEDHEFLEIESTDTALWYQSSYVMKGFSDCVVDGSSITDTWRS